MKAYKAFDINENGELQCRDMIYVVGETYEMTESPVLCGKGFHACLDINDLDDYYDVISYHGLILGKTAVCEVELLGDIDTGYRENKIATNKIKIVRQLSTKETLSKLDASYYANMPEITVILNHSTRELTHDQLDIILQSNDIRLIKNILENHSSDNDLLDKVASHPLYEVRDLLLALNLYRDKDLDIFVHASDKYLRKAVAHCGRDKDLDILVHDNNSLVRMAVARNGRDKDLDIFVHDCDVNVRALVAEHGRDKDLDILVHDEDYLVRKYVARNGRDKDLDILVHDNDYLVRFEVAKHGRDKDLDILVNDDNIWVRKVVATVYKRDKD